LSTGYITAGRRSTYRRLIETTQMVLDCMVDGTASLREGGVGWQSAIRVRFLHGYVRHRLQHSKNYDSSACDVAINQEDMIATLLGFCYNILLGLRVMGFSVSEQQQADFVHLWRLIGRLMGVLDELNPCTDYLRCKAMLESIAMHQLRPDAVSTQLAHHVLQSVVEWSPLPGSFSLLASYSRVLMGDELADQLQLPSSPLMLPLARVVFALLRLLHWVLPARLSVYLSRRRVQYLLALDGPRTNFAFKHPLSRSSARQLDAAARTAHPASSFASVLRLLAGGLVVLLLVLFFAWPRVRL